MITYEQLNEVFDRPVDWKIIKQTDIHAWATFNIDDELFTVKIEYSALLEKYVINFKSSKSNYGLSKSNKNQFKVYSTVYHIIKSLSDIGWLKKAQALYMSGSVRKQTQMYDKILLFLEKKNVLISKTNVVGGKEYYVK